MTSRRDFLGGGATLLAALGWEGCVSVPDGEKTLPAWRPGMMDLHFIYTGRGENMFYRLPDGTSVLNDVGEFYRPSELKLGTVLLPSAERLGGDWVCRYLHRIYPEKEIDYTVFSHWYLDHVGHASWDRMEDPRGAFPWRKTPDEGVPSLLNARRPRRHPRTARRRIVSRLSAGRPRRGDARRRRVRAEGLMSRCRRFSPIKRGQSTPGKGFVRRIKRGQSTPGKGFVRRKCDTEYHEGENQPFSATLRRRRGCSPLRIVKLSQWHRPPLGRTPSSRLSARALRRDLQQVRTRQLPDERAAPSNRS